MKLSFNKYYIFFNFLGLLGLYVFTLGGPKLFLRDDKAMIPGEYAYNWLETITCALLAFALSFIVSIFVDFKVDISASWKRYAWKIMIVFLLTQVLYSFLMWPMLEVAKSYVEYEKEYNLTRDKRLYNFLFFTSMASIWLFVFLTVKIYHQLKRVQLTKLQLESSLRESQLNTLKGQINPHFMFNSLNNIRGLMLEDVGKARSVLTNLSETLRYSLTKSEENSIALEDELEMVESYMEIAVDEDTLNEHIPPMIIQLLVENALKHGISNLKGGGIVRLTTTKSAKELLIEVANSGSIQKVEDSTQIGIQNIKKRLKLLYGKKAIFSLTEKDQHVFATIKIPLS